MTFNGYGPVGARVITISEHRRIATLVVLRPRRQRRAARSYWTFYRSTLEHAASCRRLERSGEGGSEALLVRLVPFGAAGAGLGLRVKM
jgi:hypothetical protein